MTRTTASTTRQARAVMIWTAGVFVAIQIFTVSLPGYPWTRRHTPEVAVRTGRFTSGTRLAEQPPKVDESIMQWQVSHLLTAVEPQDVIFVGDSSCLMGVVPERIAQDTGLKVWNFGTFASLSTAGHAQVLKLYLEHQAPPKLVVYHVSPPSLIRSAEEAERGGACNRFQMWIHGEDAGVAAQQPLAQLPGYRLRRLIADALTKRFFLAAVNPFNNSRREPFPSDDEMRQVLLQNRGFIAEPRIRKLPDRAADLDKLGIACDGFTGIRQMFEMTAARGVNLLLVMHPVPEKQRSSEVEAAYRRLEAQFRELSAAYANVEIGSPLLRYYRDDEFGMVIHLREAGALRNSAEISRVIAAKLSNGSRPVDESQPIPRGELSGEPVLLDHALKPTAPRR